MRWSVRRLRRESAPYRTSRTMPLANARRSPRDSRSSSRRPSFRSRSIASSRPFASSASVSRSLKSKLLPRTDATERTSRTSSGSRSTRASTACWIVSGSASEEMPVAPERFRAPESSRAIPPESRSERTSSFVKRGLPSVAARSRPARSSESLPPPAASSTRARCSDGVSGPSVSAAKRGSPAERLEHLGERMALVDLGLPVRPDDERRRRAEAARDVLEGLDRELRPVQLLEGEEQRLAARDARQGARDELEDRDLVLGLAPVAGLDRARVAARRGRAARRSPTGRGRARGGRPRGP